ncbi:MAG TPA: hypothetical protein VGV67_13335, partial [Solirubrobacteraceae bacterium]|nr:hypothetical protein [Solirubrobacteraceae bacterium]
MRAMIVGLCATCLLLVTGLGTAQAAEEPLGPALLAAESSETTLAEQPSQAGTCLRSSELTEAVVTDKDDYPPGETVIIDGTGFAADCDVVVRVSRPDGVVETLNATTGSDGTFRIGYLLPPPPGVWGQYDVDVLGAWGDILAAIAFTDAIAGPDSSSNANTSAGQRTLTIAKPTNTATGDFLIAQISGGGFSDAGGDETTEKICPPSGWTSIEKTVKGSDVVVQTFRKFAAASEPTSYIFEFRTSSCSGSLTPKRASGGILRYAGVDPTTPVATKSENASPGTSTTPTALGITAPAGARVVAFFGIKVGSGSGPVSVTPPAGMTERYEVGNIDGSGPTSESADVVQSGATGNKVATVSHNREWVAQLIALKEAAPADTTAPETTITSGPSGPTNDSTPTFAFSSDETGSTF